MVIRRRIDPEVRTILNRFSIVESIWLNY